MSHILNEHREIKMTMLKNTVKAIKELYEVAGICYVAPIIEKQVDINSHTEVAMIIAEIYGTDEDKAQLEVIYERHKKQGFMTTEDSQMRSSIDDKVKSTINSYELSILNEVL